MKLIQGFQGAVFGIVDGFIMLTGIVASVYRATADPRLVLMAGITAAIADSLANAVGFYASELAERGQQIHMRQEHGETTRVHSKREVLISAVFSLLATPPALVVPLVPFIFMPMLSAVIVSLTTAITAVFLLGCYIGRLSGERSARMGLRYALIGIVGALTCYIIGGFVKILTGL